ncbi:ABC transporter ATP-binding protein [Desulfohalobium retbaense]|uniref:ABC transporter related protein n=1 Tax=Desulfohalobium retbaense (strain ATCC 49708 / DSM 5692 / JCM 16813 / HR100) TaxID=485915 RepID=C8X1J1_DESRD|nr:ABC transporter ATP-binding protein [Desulfohalobium retbaense]ACV68288.1 ABC transporter related protein [Desulfohalobium retbaense DSM 5692]
MLRLVNLHVSVGDKEVLKGVDLEIADGETFILFGPNGSGKTTLLMTLMGFAGYKVTKGKILFRGEDITSWPVHERAKLGIGMSFQRPPTIHGLKTRQLVELCAQGRERDVEDLARKVNFEQFLDRDINAGFSGGEIKRSELLQLMSQEPKLLLFDEPESGVDLENMKLIGKTVRDLLQGDLQPRSDMSMKELKAQRQTSGLIITHTGYILDYINADRGKVMYDGVLCCEARPRDILDHVSQYGYQECVRCLN